MKKLFACVFALALSSTAFAQETTTTTDTTVATTTTGTDGEQLVGRFGVGLQGGVSGLSLASTAGGGTISDIEIPIVGVRYWLPDMEGGFFKRMGVDVGVGFAFGGGSFETEAAGTTTSTDAPSVFGLGLNVGVPMVLADFKHVNFEVVPQVNLNYTSASFPDRTGVTDDSASRFDLGIGAAAGFEVFFGFIGIPQLSLEATVGLGYNLETTNAEATVGTNKESDSTSAWSVQTLSGNEPWDIFQGANLSARFYF